jgi:hypothetical protein
MKKQPMIRGGQGRQDNELLDAGTVLIWMLVITIVALAVIALVS